MNRLLITGAAGGLGKLARARLGHLADTLRLADMADLGDAEPNEELLICDLADKSAVDAMVEGCDGIVHFGGRSLEDSWEIIRDSNIEGVFNLYEAARRHGVSRIFYASSNHAIGYHQQTQQLDAEAVTRPDSLYGVSKVFGEALATMYYDKFGIETANVRIGSCFPEPRDHRMLSTWISEDDMVSLIECVFRVPRLGCPVIYGVSDNAASWWDNTSIGYLGWKPQDNSEKFRSKIDAVMETPAVDDPVSVYQGGIFTVAGIAEKPTGAA